MFFSSFLRNEYVDRSSFRSVGSLFHARGAATEKALSLIRRHVRGMTRLPHDEIMRVYRRLVSASPICTPAYVQEATCELASTVIQEKCQRIFRISDRTPADLIYQ